MQAATVSKGRSLLPIDLPAAMKEFKLVAEFSPAGHQPQAIESLARGVHEGREHQVLLGVTGSGKTFAIAGVIEKVQRPTLVVAHNKTLAAQLYREFKELFPENSVEYFVSYYDYYTPEAYVPTTDTYIAKESQINDEIDRLRHSATRAVLERRDVIVVASVSCIFAMGNPSAYRSLMMELKVDDVMPPEKVCERLVQMQYVREHFDFHRGSFRLRGDVLEVFPSWEAGRVLRVSFFGDQVERIEEVDALTGKSFSTVDKALVLPNTHYASTQTTIDKAVEAIRSDLQLRKTEFVAMGKPHYAERIEQRTLYDLEMLEISGGCAGIENYSVYMDGRQPGEAPYTLVDFFPEDFLCVVDESHVTYPQLTGMYKGDRHRKETLVKYGFRLPSAMDNRPLTFAESMDRIGQKISISATPGDWELSNSDAQVVELIVRPTGLVDPVMHIRPATTQVEDLLPEIWARVKKKERVLVATLTKRMAEDLTEYLREQGISAAYLHADIDTLERVELLYALREGKYDVMVGINLLREGLDLPEVSLVAVLDADKEGFLRAERSLIQVAGRAARNLQGTVILYADDTTRSMRLAIEETDRRRGIQEKYNAQHGIVPRSIEKKLMPMPRLGAKAAATLRGQGGWKREVLERELARLRKEMKESAKRLEFERAAELRDQIASLHEALVKA